MSKKSKQVIIGAADLQELINSIKSAGYDLYGPTVRDSAIRLDRINSIDDLPRGFRDTQKPGTYKLEKSDSPDYFEHVVGIDNWKKLLYPARRKLFNLTIEDQAFKFSEHEIDSPPLAFLGVRSCDLAAIEILDKILMRGPYADQGYKHRREKSLIIAVNCTSAAQSCFCTSMKTGPRAVSGFDLALTEICQDNRHEFLIEIGTDKGAAILESLKTREAENQDIKTVDHLVKQTAEAITRKLNTTDLKEILFRNFENPIWERISRRCLSCGNCTMVCPTCFCMNIEDLTDLEGETATRQRRWDSCFTLEHSYIHGGSVRTSVKSRYRQWLTHKLASWQDQFGSSGCTGCGRCITWCPVGIDITEEARNIRASEHENNKSAKRKD